ncbi:MULTISPECIES: HAD family hydrolase [Methylobacterium]|jgi:HAD superfamily hydrolase (TIGR01509 family)|uniref:HAD family hydrolase n=1 Tax=Methylobacterium TaxID=407 RepID=UPI0008ACA967|nr:MULTISPECIES: HAD family hydrolase [Methylobacterium]MBK3399193.1 HAD family hydrolase [Methylobacterium ajmalii]MBK3410729.1 HAD family hydrolase [Methylobacterium ajmalii]MBK3425666.1 HAD family hydrolase [Methylobacterium ajmalii]MBZ6414558.1 HAD family hydrolase [Methylobacterium sp.]SEP40029.1 haloacid dehalogenase superfamily, subfamily IA, variant 3 with third motif having DD or ED/haloacid dehalogenase superfamily, subfamily IA, variant 1 with third motif having Dx(3-4)D or Dx(3-4)E
MSGRTGGRPELVIFDCDGVLIDSEPISLARLTENLQRIGVPIDLATVARRFTGTSMTSIMAHIATDYGVPTPEGFVDAVRADTLRAFDAELQAIAGVAAVLETMPDRRCVASSSDPQRLRHALTLTGLLRHFDGHVFSATMVSRGKPFPDLFLYAAAQMGVAPEACVVIEDSVPGVAAARAAGIPALGFCGGGHWSHDRAGADLLAAGAVRVFDEFADLPHLLGTWDRVSR